MTLSTHFNTLIELLLDRYSKRIIPAQQLINTIDLTLLDEKASSASLVQLGELANKHSVAAVCIYANHIQHLPRFNNFHLATVINFPNGMDELTFSLDSIEKAKKFGACEIDYVFPHPLYLKGNQQTALNHCNEVIQLCNQHKLTLKIILETELFPNGESIYQITRELVTLGPHFIKTSTGKLPLGASLYAAFAILCALKETRAPCGIKISGGISSPIQAMNYAHLAELMLEKSIDKYWFRIGTSSLLNKLLMID